VADIAAQLSEVDELVVVDQSAGALADAGRRAVEATPRARWLAHQPPGLPGARNRAVGATSAEVLLFFDDDVHLHGGCLEGHRRPYLDPEVGGVVGRIVERRLEANASRLCNAIGRDGRIRTRLDGCVAGEVASLKGANMSLRRQALWDAGPFEEALGGTALLEDAELSERVVRRGWRLRFAPDAAVDHDHDPEGGVRQPTSLATLQARFRNTGFFLGRHRPRRDLPLVVAAHAAVAVRHGGPVRAPGLLTALASGWRAGRTAPWPAWPDRSDGT
jgi:GT2 family glycosyltransferase